MSYFFNTHNRATCLQTSSTPGKGRTIFGEKEIYPRIPNEESSSGDKTSPFVLICMLPFVWCRSNSSRFGLFEVHVPFAWHVIGEVLFSFHGVIIAVVHIIASGDAVEFLGIKVGRSLSMIEIQVNKEKPIIQSDGTNMVLANSHVTTARRSVAFSIFQELTEEEKWKRFGVYVGSEDDDDDSRNFEEQYIDNTHSVVKFDTKSEENTHESNSQGQIIIQDSPFHQTS